MKEIVAEAVQTEIRSALEDEQIDVARAAAMLDMTEGALRKAVERWQIPCQRVGKRVDETMLYVHVAEQHHRDVPQGALAAGARETDPDRRVLAMLGSRARISWQPRGSETAPITETGAISAA